MDRRADQEIAQPSVPTFLQDLIYSARGLRKSPAFACVAIGALAIGIGATAATFSLLDAALLRPLPFRDAGRLVAISERPPLRLRNSVSPATYLDWRDQNHSFEAMGAMAFHSQTLTGDGAPSRLSGQQVTASYFEMLGVQPVIGRLFNASEENLALALINRRLWSERFAGDAAVIGRAITLDGHPYTICGVLPPQARVQGDPDVWTPLPLDRQHARRSSHTLWVIGRMKPGVGVAQASAEMDVIARRIADAAPETNAGWGVTVDPLQSYLVGTDLRTTSLALFGAVGFLLLLSCVNVASLLMVRGAGRTREVAVRAALGASRGRIVAQLLSESLLLSALGGGAGLWIASLLLAVAPRLLPAGAIPAAIPLELDTRVVWFTLAVSIATGVLFGLAPAWTLSKTGLTEAMRSAGRAVTSAGRVRNVLASVEIALALVLLSGAGLLVRTLLRLEKTDRGYETGNVLTLRVSLPKASYPTNARAIEFYQAAEREVASLPGVQSAGFSVDLPLGGWSFGEPFEIVGNPVPSASRPSAHIQLVGPMYFDAVGIRFARGRPFNSRDTEVSAKVCIINEALARGYFADRDPLGAFINTLGGPRQVVGVIRQVRVDGPADSAALEIYVPYTQSEAGGMALSVRTLGDPLTMTKPVAVAIARVDKDLALTEIQTLEEIANQSVGRPRFRAVLAAAFALAALTLAVIGVYGVLAFGVSQRLKEFGIRLALGATSTTLLRLVLRDGLRIAAVGLASGMAAAGMLSRLLARFLFDVKPLDPLTFIGVPVLLGLVTLLACLIPARRAMAVDPMTALRDE
jgi:putative ABC transport system permease protein